MDELFGPIIGITLVLMSVFLPAAFVPGLTGNMFAQFALVIAATALISAINAATLKPTQCALWLRAPVPPEKRNFIFRAFNAAYDPMERGYANFIGKMVHRSGLMVIVALIVSGLGVWGLTRIPTAFIPIDDQGYLLVALQLPEGAAMGRTSEALTKTADLAREIPGVERVISVTGMSLLDNSADLFNAGAAWVMLKPFDERLKAKGQDLLSIYKRLSAALIESSGRTGPRPAAARDPGHRQRRRLPDAARTARRQHRLSETRRTHRRDRRRRRQGALAAECADDLSATRHRM